jgi:Tfp pilus assembly protein PilO
MMKNLLSMGGLALAGGIFFLYTQPAYDEVQILNEEISQYDQALEKATELQQLKQSLLSRFNAFRTEDLDRLQKSLPDHVDNVRLILDLDNLAARHGMALQNVVISGPASGSGGTTAIGAIGLGHRKFDSLTMKFTTRGSYEDFTTFLGDLEASLRIVNVVSLNLVREGNVSTGALTYRYDITIRTYWLK